MAQQGKSMVGTALDLDLLGTLDEFCEVVHRNRAEVLRGLLYALLIEGKQNIFDEWREEWKETR
jgi:hypothetical protein